MAWAIMPKPGEIDCEGACKHLDCKAIRELMKTKCAVCGKLIKGGEKYQKALDDNTRDAHFKCNLEVVEDRRAIREVTERTTKSLGSLLPKF